jgi:hypothetical protein
MTKFNKKVNYTVDGRDINELEIKYFHVKIIIYLDYYLIFTKEENI